MQYDADELLDLLARAYVDGWDLERCNAWVSRVGRYEARHGCHVVDEALVRLTFPEAFQATPRRRKPHKPRPADPTRMPELLMVADIAAAANWPTWRVRRALKRRDILVKRGRKFFTTTRLLAERFPELLDVLSAHYSRNT